VHVECPISERKFSVCRYKGDSLDFYINNSVVHCFEKSVLDFCAIYSTSLDKMMNGESKVSHVFSSNPQGSRLGGRSQDRRWNCVKTDISIFYFGATAPTGPGPPHSRES
jgi:hypothetical protein